MSASPAGKAFRFSDCDATALQVTTGTISPNTPQKKKIVTPKWTQK